MSALAELTQALASGAVRVVDLTHTLDPDFPVIVLPLEEGFFLLFLSQITMVLFTGAVRILEHRAGGTTAAGGTR